MKPGNAPNETLKVQNRGMLLSYTLKSLQKEPIGTWSPLFGHVLSLGR